MAAVRVLICVTDSFLGVTFIRSQTVKSKHDLSLPQVKTITQNKANRITETLAVENLQEVVIDHYQESVSTPADEQSLRFIEEDLSAEHFPSEPEPDETLAPPSPHLDSDVSSKNEPRLKTLYLMEPGSVLGKQHERFVIKHKGEVVKEIPAIHVDQIMVFGSSQLTTQVMQFCLQQRIPIYLLSGKGRYYGAVDSFDTEPVLLHREQFLRSDEKSFCLQLGQQFIKGKMANSRLILKRHARHKSAPAFDSIAA